LLCKEKGLEDCKDEKEVRANRIRESIPYLKEQQRE